MSSQCGTVGTQRPWLCLVTAATTPRLFGGAQGGCQRSVVLITSHWRTLDNCRKLEQVICVYSGGHRPRSKDCKQTAVKKPV